MRIGECEAGQTDLYYINRAYDASSRLYQNKYRYKKWLDIIGERKCAYRKRFFVKKKSIYAKIYRANMI